jgi:threonine dehydrogenase-like Zn-dependent dehydrogenase
MKALEFYKSIPRYVLLKMLGSRMGRRNSMRLASLALRDKPEPRLPGPDWVRIRPKLAGICGSDLATINASGSPYLAPLTSMPFVMGHELVGCVSELGDDVDDIQIGQRVVLHPALGCVVRGITPVCEHCANGCEALCRNLTRGRISSGVQTGFCRDTGGGFSESLVAHRSQIYCVPDDMPDSAAVLIEPFACALHGALRVSVQENDTVLVIGCGAIGLLTIAALRAMGNKSRIVAVCKYDHQSRHAKNLGATEVIPASGNLKQQYATWAKTLDAEVLDPELGKPTVLGGADVTFDCVASSHTIDDGLRFTRSGGQFVLVGMPGIPKNVDWTALWFKELSVHATYAYGPERIADGRKQTFDLAIELMGKWSDRLMPLVGKPFELNDYRAALSSAMMTGQSGVAKTVFAIDPPS